MEPLERYEAQAQHAFRPTVWDARRLAHSLIGQRVGVVFDNGQHGRVRREGVLMDIQHSPDQGFALKLKNVGDERRIDVLPVSLMSELPQGLSFLAEPPELWEFPLAYVLCLGCGHSQVAGRFCPRCGKKCRRTNAHLGPGFRARQIALRRVWAEEVGGEERVVEHSCGAILKRTDLFCEKCGRMNPEKENEHS